MNDVKPDRLREHRYALVQFHNAYVAYLEASAPSASPDLHERARLRTEATALIPAAQIALLAAEVNLALPPSPFGGPILSGLPNTAFAHEHGAYGEVPRMVLDTVRLADSYLAEQEKEVERQRGNPLYWADQILRAVLGFPAYLLSLILGVPFERIDQSPWGRAFNLAGLVASALGTYFGGQAAGWW